MISAKKGIHAASGNSSGPKHARPSEGAVSLSPGHKAVIAAASAVFAIGVGLFGAPLATSASAQNGIAYGEPVEQMALGQYDEEGTISDAELLRFSNVVSDGAPLDAGVAYAIIESDAAYTSNVGEILQNEIMRGGCEVVSLTIALDSVGYPIQATEIADNYLSQDGDFVNGYAGSPYTTGGGFPPGLVKAANLYLADASAPCRAHDITGTSREGVETLVAYGYPVLVWTTMLGDEPIWSGISGDGVTWYDNEHCLVVYGVSEDTVLVSDPLVGLDERDAEAFWSVYESCGNMALAIY